MGFTCPDDITKNCHDLFRSNIPICKNMCHFHFPKASWDLMQ